MTRWSFCFARRAGGTLVHLGIVPLGASLADWVAVDPLRGGLGWGTRLVSAVGLLVIAACVAGMQMQWSRASRSAD